MTPLNESPSSGFSESAAALVERQERLQRTRERMRLVCGTVSLLCDKTHCTIAEATELLGDTESHVADWQAILQRNNDPPPTKGELNAFFLALPISQRRGIMERLESNGKTERQPERPKQTEQRKQPKASLSSISENAHQNRRTICAMADYLHEQFEILFKETAAAFDMTPQYLSLLRAKVKKDGGRGMKPELALLALARKIGMERLTDLADQSPRVKRIRGENVKKPLPPRHEHIARGWRQACAMIEALQTQFGYAVRQATDTLRVSEQCFYTRQKTFKLGGGHGIPPEEALLLLAKKLGMRKLLELSDTLPRVQKRRAAEEAERKLQESFSQEDAEWRILVAVELLLEAGIDEPLARAAMDVSAATFERYWQKFRQRERTPEDRGRAAVLVLDLFDGEVPKKPEEIQWHLAKLYGNRMETPTRRYSNVMEATQEGNGDGFEGSASDEYAPTDAFPGRQEKRDVMLERIRRGDPSAFHPLDRCAYIDMKRRDFLRKAIAEGMEKDQYTS